MIKTLTINIFFFKLLIIIIIIIIFYGQEVLRLHNDYYGYSVIQLYLFHIWPSAYLYMKVKPNNIRIHLPWLTPTVCVLYHTIKVIFIIINN